MRIFLFISISIVSVAYGQTSVSKKYEEKDTYNYTALTLYSNYTYNYEFSGCLGAGGDSGTYKVNSDTLELNSFKGLNFVAGGFSLIAISQKDSTKLDSIAIQIMNHTEYNLKNIRITFDNFETTLSTEISSNRYFKLNVKSFSTNGIFTIDFPSIGRQYHDTLSSKGNALYILLYENKLSREQEIPLRQVKFHMLKNKICPISKSAFETDDCLPKLKLTKR